MQYRLIFHVPGKPDHEQIVEQSMVEPCINLAKPVGAWTENAGEYDPAKDFKQPIVKPDGEPMLESSIIPKEDTAAIILELMEKNKELESLLQTEKELTKELTLKVNLLQGHNGTDNKEDRMPDKIHKARYVKNKKK